MSIAPYLLYEDAAAALEWLATAFGFVEQVRVTADDGSVTHAEMALGDGRILLGQPGGGYHSPARTGARGVVVYVFVDDVDAHLTQAQAAGASVTAMPREHIFGDRRYDCTDLEGHRWAFAQRPAWPKLTTIFVDRENRFALELDEQSGSTFVSFPVENAYHAEYSEEYRVDKAAFDRYVADPTLAHDFVRRAKRRELDHLLVHRPGSSRGWA